MGPQSYDCGNKFYGLDKGWAALLQWGRSRTTAEISGWKPSKKPPVLLQWGRSRTTAEI